MIPEGYEAEIKTIVKNKVNFCRKCLSSDYYRHVFPDAESSRSATTYGRTNYIAPTEAPAEETITDIVLPTEAVVPDDTQALPPDETVPVVDDTQNVLPPAEDTSANNTDTEPVPAPPENQEAAE